MSDMVPHWHLLTFFIMFCPLNLSLWPRFPPRLGGTNIISKCALWFQADPSLSPRFATYKMCEMGKPQLKHLKDGDKYDSNLMALVEGLNGWCITALCMVPNTQQISNQSQHFLSHLPHHGSLKYDHRFLVLPHFKWWSLITLSSSVGWAHF